LWVINIPPKSQSSPIFKKNLKKKGGDRMEKWVRLLKIIGWFLGGLSCAICLPIMSIIGYYGGDLSIGFALLLGIGGPVYYVAYTNGEIRRLLDSK
jgi:hypothetical protein